MSDESLPAGKSWLRAAAGRFEWFSPSPSPAEVAELERLFPEIIQVPELSLEAEASSWRSLAIIVRSLSRWVPPEAIVREFHRAGVPGEIEAVSLVNKHYFFRFADPQARDLALARPWVVNGQALAVSAWQSEFVPGSDSVLSALLWIRLPLLPMEFWTEEILASILSVAGVYQYSDAATKSKNRGGFARACVRVDLGRSLRPGARVRGTKQPFWQQFSYENLEGICGSCGALHHAEPCSMQPKLHSSTDGVRFGPWMAAVRRRKTPVLLTPAIGKKDQGPVLHSPVSMEGWQVPKNPVRRKGNRGSIADQSPSFSPEASGSSRRATVQPCRSKSSVPVPASESHYGELMTDSQQPLPRGNNPFSALVSELETMSPEPSKDLTPCQSKRARPIDSNPQRRASKASKAKGKGSLSAKGKEPASFTFSASADSVQGSCLHTQRGTKKLRNMAEPTLESASGVPQLVQRGGNTHEAVVYQLKQAILKDNIVVDVDSSQSEMARGNGLIEDFPPACDHSVGDLPGDRIGAPIPDISG